MPAADSLLITLPDRLEAQGIAPLWRSVLQTLAANPDRAVVIDARPVRHADDAGIAFLFDLKRRERPPGAAVELSGVPDKIAALLGRFDPAQFRDAPRDPATPGLIEAIGRATAVQAQGAKGLVAFLGELSTALAEALARPARVSWRVVLDIAQEAGANAAPIVMLIGFLMGVIMAFQVAVVAQQFGAIIFVVNGVAIAILRELGALMTAVIFAGRSGAAFAAELGTQKVNQEISALVTFGLDPVRFLAVPRVIASVLVMPLLAMLANVIGLFGGALVMLQYDVSFTQYYVQLRGAVGIADLLFGLIKAAVFGLMIAGIGCQRGLATGQGAASVGLSATSAVVTSIVLVVVVDGIFAVLFNRLGF